MLTDDELESMRDTIVASLPQIGEVQAPSNVSDGRGGQAVVWNTVASVPIRVAPDTTRTEEVVGDRVANQQRWMLTMPAGTTVGASYRIVVESRTFEVVNIRSPRSYETSCRVVGIEVL